MRIGYARVSTDDQTLDLQRDALKRAKCRQIYEEHASGKTAMRPELEACLKSLRKGDTLVVWRLDRLGRSLGDLIQLTTELRSRGVDFESLTEKIETSSSAGKLVFHVFASLAEFERNLIRERTLAGLKAARARGRNGGRPRKTREQRYPGIKALLNAGELPVQDIADRLGVARSTLYRNAASPESSGAQDACNKHLLKSIYDDLMRWLGPDRPNMNRPVDGQDAQNQGSMRSSQQLNSYLI